MKPLKICFSGAELFISFLEDKDCLDEVLGHEAYRAVFKHAEHYGCRELTRQDIEEALKGESTPFYGLEDVRENLPRIKDIIKTIRKKESAWLKDVSDVYSSLLPDEDIGDITIYPIIGYDAGIGFQGSVCMNLNWEPSLNDPNEFLYFMIHEVFHVLYQRIHEISPLKKMETKEDWLSYFQIFLQNEGYAVYAPLHLRETRNHLRDRDYIVLGDKGKIEEHIETFINTLEFLEQRRLTPDEYSDHIFGPKRLTYRVGCELIRRIERSYGYEAVKKGIYLDADRFLSKYKHLLLNRS